MLNDYQVDSACTFVISLAIFVVITLWAILATRAFNAWFPNTGNSLTVLFIVVFLVTLGAYFLIKWMVKELNVSPPPCTGYVDTLYYRLMDKDLSMFH